MGQSSQLERYDMTNDMAASANMGIKNGSRLVVSTAAPLMGISISISLLGISQSPFMPSTNEKGHPHHPHAAEGRFHMRIIKDFLHNIRLRSDWSLQLLAAVTAEVHVRI